MRKETKRDLIHSLILLIVVYILMGIDLPYYIASPGSIENIEDTIKIDSNYTYDSTINSTYVSEYSGVSIIEAAYALINPNWDLIKVSDELYDGQSEEEAYIEGKADLEESLDNAYISAYKLAGIPYTSNGYNFVVTYIFNDANTDLSIGDRISMIDGNIINSKNDILNYINNSTVGTKIELTTNNGIKYAYIDTEGERKVIGITGTDDYDLLSSSITFNKDNNVFGPSAGLMMSIYIYSNITALDLPDNLIIAGTGTIDELGNVGKIGGVKYKLIGAASNGANVFLVPSANYDEALKVKNDKGYDIKLIKVDTLSEAIDAIEALSVIIGL